MTKTVLRIGLMFVGVMICISGCTRPEASPPVAILPVPPAPSAAQGCPAQMVQEGKASWYGAAHRGEKTASGDRFDPAASTAAHRTLPLGTPIEVTNLENGHKTTLIVNDRGPHKKGRVLDISQKGAEDLGFVSDGTTAVRIETVRNGCAREVQASTTGN